MSSSPPVELVVASFDDPILAGLLAARGDRPAGTSRRVGGAPPVDAGIVFLVARQVSETVGCAGLRRLGDDTAEVEHVYVRPEYRGQGISRLLLAGVEDLARRRGFAVARLEAGDLRSAGLYASSGYVRIAPFGRHPARSVCFEKSLLVPLTGGRMPGPRRTFPNLPR
ncbi:GNAT family N-acetyltransferase [Actinomadura sp. DC4]|uniref:GNAT family N-acetyltransferase n=1 Tax=Actinomadura sp. DC4 TaxID=3055069 RepID=UPI0025AFF52C|nr:GNAT family N-acetyltransferase [Actinomadura sp. DC4]MDN3356562.1 GNAT family N-acetyltransferase [Actinomadura sp. DC4]